MTVGGWMTRISRSLALAARLATSRFPVASLLILVNAVLSNLVVAGWDLMPETDLVWLYSALCAGAAASVGARLFAEARSLKPSLQILLPVAAAAVFGLIVWSASALGVLAPPLVAAVVLAMPLLPYAGRGDGGRFWTFTLWSAVGITLAFLSVMFFVLGVSAILEMIRYLFDVGLDSDAYIHIYVTASTLVGPLFALGRIPTDFDEAAPTVSEDRLAAGVRFLIDWVGAPLALATAVVLHLYAGKIVFADALPKNQIGWIVSFYAVFVLAFRVAAEPFIANGGLPTRFFARSWGWMLVVPLVLLTYSVSLRILSQGVTLERYYLALCALVIALIIAVQAMPRWRGDIRLIAGIPLMLLTLSAFGPWGAGDVVGRSQIAWIESEMSPVVKTNAGTVDLASVPSASKPSVRSRLDALDDAGELERALPLMEPDRRIAVEAAARDSSLSSAFSTTLNLYDNGTGANQTAELTGSFEASKASTMSTSGYDVVIPDRTFLLGETWSSYDDDTVAVRMNDLSIEVRVAGIEDRFDLRPAIRAITRSTPADTPDHTAIAPTVTELTSAAGHKIGLRIMSASWTGAERRPQWMVAALLLRSADWRLP